MHLKQTLISTLMALALGAVTCAPVAAGGAGRMAAANTASLSQNEIDIMVFMREEEKLARDVYLTLHEQWGLPILSNIAGSEQQHTSRIRDLLQTYRIADPVQDDTTGIFQNEELASLYHQLLARGQTSQLDALYTGAFVEETDILDLQQAIAVSTQPAIRQVYNKLLQASRNHLRAFAGQIINRTGSYTAQAMPAAEVDAIINSPREQDGGPRGPRRGMH
ncbi:MAG: DUF2202 domain-containing protein [Thiolinea sp.]